MITLGILSDFSDDERAQLQAALDLVNAAILDPDFLSILSNASYDSTDETNVAVMAKISRPVTITRLYCENMGWWATHVQKTVAAEDPDGTVTFNRPYFDSEPIEAKANTLFHEFLHCIGEHHVCSTDYQSWPYQGGNLLEAYLKSGKPQTASSPQVSQPDPLPVMTT